MLDLTGKIAFVAGAGTVGPGWGNGKATAVLLARQGARVFATDIDATAARETCELIEKEGGECVAHRCNMTVAPEVQAAVDACFKSRDYEEGRKAFMEKRKPVFTGS